MENKAIQSTKHSQRKKLNQANPIFHKKKNTKKMLKYIFEYATPSPHTYVLINNNSLKIPNRSIKSERVSEFIPVFLYGSPCSMSSFLCIV